MTDESTRREREALIAGERALNAEEAADLSLFADLLADPSSWAEPDTALEDSVVRAVVEADGDVEDGDVEAGGKGEVYELVPPIPIGVHRKRRAWIPALAVAAAVVIVLGAFAVLRDRTSSDFNSQLSATALAPGASGTADVTKTDAGFHVTLDAHGLPALPPGQFYQAWLKNDAGTLVPIGSFSSSDGKVTLWSGVSPKDFPTLTVTIESTDNDQTSSGRRVLVGPIHPS
jgi:hypothetical protein